MVGELLDNVAALEALVVAMWDELPGDEQARWADYVVERWDGDALLLADVLQRRWLDEVAS
ncbi:MAG TPA: hypothetical protein PKB06_10200 [Actinotalea sp.]|nr:hypothetical protein [Actinotalea sp.]